MFIGNGRNLVRRRCIQQTEAKEVLQAVGGGCW